MRLQTKLVLLITSLVLLVIAVFGIYFESLLVHNLKEQIGTRALQIAETAASMPGIVDAYSKDEPTRILQPIAEKIRMETGALYVVFADSEGIRYTHPDPTRIGFLTSTSNSEVFKGRSIITESMGTLGPTLRAKTPLFDQDKNIIGLVSVGFSVEAINQIIANYHQKIINLAIIVLVIGILGAMYISNNVKKAILGLEPKEIANLYQEKKAVLESIKEGVLAVNSEGRITNINHQALKMFQWGEEKDVKGKYISEFLPDISSSEFVHSCQIELDQEILIHDEIFLINRLPIYNSQGKTNGAVASFRYKSELYRVRQELTQVKQYAQALRSQTHEFSNKLHMISGLIQLESYQEAVELIMKESDLHQDLLHFVMQRIPDLMVGGLLIGKFNRASELRINLNIDKESSFRDIPAELDRDCITTIIGNLIDNAMDAVLKPEAREKIINMSFSDYGKDLIIEVEDFGQGIKQENLSKIFEKGFSTKSKKNHGIGLYLVKRSLEKLNGYITYSANKSGGSIFTVVIPKKVNPE